jgi:transglutaminase-like putative cysteine protease
MAQQYRDYLNFRHGVPLDKIKVCHGTHKDFPDFAHAWLEVLGKKGWRVFDPSPRGGWNHKYRPGDYYSQFNFTRSWGGAIIFQPPPHAGYKRRGDRLIEDKWRRGPKEDPGKWYRENVSI